MDLERRLRPIPFLVNKNCLFAKILPCCQGCTNHRANKVQDNVRVCGIINKTNIMKSLASITFDQLACR